MIPINPKNRLKYPKKQNVSTLNNQFVTDSYRLGGKPFVASMLMYGVNERGEKLRIRNWVLEYAELLGDFRVHETLTTGASQIGKTLYNTLLLCYCLTDGGLSTLWSYDQERSLNIQAPSNFRPVAKQWLAAKGIILKQSEGSQNNLLFQVKGASAQFTYVSTSKSKEGGGAAAGGIAVGVSRDILFKEERSQYPPGADAPLNRRLDAGRLPSKPIRQLGTPGGGAGIEAEIETANYYFYPHCQCRKCEHEFPLNPMGILLKVTGKRNGKKTYLSETGRPTEWYCKDPNNAVETAYFACPQCGEEIPDFDRSHESWFRCMYTGIDLADYLASLKPGIPDQRVKVGICLSPLLRESETNLATEIIREGVETFNAADWCQQRLGLPSETSANSVTLQMLKEAIKAQAPKREPDFILAGIDQGRAEYWLWKCAYYLPTGWEKLPPAQVLEMSKREVIFAGDIMMTEVTDRIKDCKLTIIDNEPNITTAAELCSKSKMAMANQLGSQLDAVKLGTVVDGGIEFPCWKIRNSKFLKQVLDAFAGKKYILPDDWTSWEAKPIPKSPLKQLQAPQYDNSSGKWSRPKDHNDDLYYAAMFCEVAFYLTIIENNKQSSLDKWEQSRGR